MRVRKKAAAAAGKGFNCAQALALLGHKVDLLSGVGLDASAWEEECFRHRLVLSPVPLDGPIRMATTIQESDGRTTELVEEGPHASAGAWSCVQRRLGEHPAAGPVVACGSLPEGLPASELSQALLAHPGLVVIDSVPLVREILSSGAERSHPGLVLKLNAQEWHSCLGVEEPALIAARTRKKFPLVALVVTMGNRGAWVQDQEGVERDIGLALSIPAEECYPIGAGDAFTAGLVAGLAEGQAFLEAALQGSRVAELSCRHELPSRFDPEEWAVLRREVAT